MTAHAYTPAEVEHIAKRLGGAGGAYRCPAHDDRTASLSLSLGDDGRLLWHCHAGCGQAAVLDGLRAAGVLLNGDARPAEPRPKARRRGRIVASYPYVDEAGVLLFEVVRLEPKEFRQRRPDGKGGWIWKLNGTRRALYRLPEVLAADTMVFVEGEKDAINVTAAGLCGTTSSQGAKFWRHELAAPLKGKRVVIIPDNDPVGREHAHKVAAAARRHGATSVKVVELDGLAEHGDVSDWLKAGHTADELRDLITRAPEWEPLQREEPEDDEQAEVAIRAQEAGEHAEGEEDDDQRPLIRVYGGGLHHNAVAAVKALGDATHASPFEGVYRRGSLLVRPARLHSSAELERAGVKRPPGTLTILPVDPDYLVFALTRTARFERYDARSEAWVPVNAPAPVAKALAAAADQIGHVPPLAGIVEAPTIRPDGTVLDRPGYDPATRLLFDPGGVEFPPVPANPTRAQAEAALKVLRQPLAEFPFSGEGSESVAASLIPTALARKAMRAAPLHVFNAHKMASGKTLLATLGGYVATGRAPAMMSQAEDPDSERKRLLAVLLEGTAMVVIDNVERPLKSDALCSILAEPLFTDRLLGLSKTASAPTNTSFTATGNNIVVSGDLTSRAVVCTVDPGLERPEERRFKVDLHEFVPANRGALVAAALTVIRAYLAAGEPLKGELPNFARFEDWSRFVREPSSGSAWPARA